MVLVIGDINVDFLVTVPRFPEYDDDVSIDSLKIEGGGFAANTAYALKKLGTETSLAGCVGDDPNGKDALGPLEEIGVDISGVVTKGAGTGMCLSVIDKTGVRRLMTHRGANLAFEFSDMGKNVLDGAKWIHVAGLRPDVAFDTIRNSGNVSWDPGKIVIESDAEIPEDVIRKIDYLLLNEREWMALGGKGKRCASKFRTAVVKKGDKGVDCYEYGKKLFGISPFEVQAVDSTGAGDVFNAAFIHAMVTERRDFNSSLVFASAAGACSVTRIGARSGAPALEDVLRVLTS